VHESCHAISGLALGNKPTLEPVRFLGVVPFFAVSPNVSCYDGYCLKASGAPFLPGPRGLYFIVSAGIICQEVTNEVILSVQPRIRYDDAAYLKGMLAFNTLASVAYALANLFALEPPQGDIRTMGSLVPVPHAVLSGLILATAALDISRYYFPDEEWLAWASRITKVATVGIVFAF